MNIIFTLIVSLCVLSVFGQQHHAPSERPVTSSPTNTETELDALFSEAYPPDSPGATVLIAKNDQVIYRKAFGMANVELQVPMKPENVLQLASITKQFTSVAILLLMEEGKLSLQDPLSTYIEDYPRGNEMTIHHLLSHTSGIISYTNLPEFRAKTRQDMTPEEMIGFFKDLPLEFNPGEKFAYSNSGYVLLGYIIEKLSGKTYGDFIRERIFEPLGMKHSYYADPYKIIPGKANGYQLYEGTYELAEYMSVTIPYAAGSLLSTVDDLFLWQQALQHNTLISEKSKHMAFTNNLLSDGKASNYGYGWYINELAGRATLEHTGGINGFTTSGIYVPDSNLYAIVLTNRDDGKGPEAYNLQAVSLVLGHPMLEREPIQLSEKQLKKWVGTYQFEDAVRFITCENGTLFSAREGGRSFKLVPLSTHEFQFEGLSTMYTFSVKRGRKQVLYADRIEKKVGVETDKKPVSEKEAIMLPKAMLMNYVGMYELQPDFQLEILMQNERLFAVAAGQPALELFAEAENRFFIRELGAQISFHPDPNGAIQSLTFSQGGQHMEGKKTK